MLLIFSNKESCEAQGVVGEEGLPTCHFLDFERKLKMQHCLLHQNAETWSGSPAFGRVIILEAFCTHFHQQAQLDLSKIFM
jgi:hypothetical protein